MRNEQKMSILTDGYGRPMIEKKPMRNKGGRSVSIQKSDWMFEDFIDWYLERNDVFYIPPCRYWH